MNKIKTGQILEFEFVFAKKRPRNRIELLNGLDKGEALAMVAFISEKLLPVKSSIIDYSVEVQMEILLWILRIEPSQTKRVFFQKLLKQNVIIFNRSSNIFIITELINSDLTDGTGSGMVNSDQLLGFLCYYLCVNSEINYIQAEEAKLADIDELNAKLASSAEYHFSSNPLYYLLRGRLLFDHILDSETYAAEFQKYIEKISGYEPRFFLREIAGMYFRPNHEDSIFFSWIKLEKPNQIFHSFSERPPKINAKFPLDSSHIKRSPIYRVSDLEYIVLDSQFLLERSCDGTVWDFLFSSILNGISEEKIRGSSIKQFRGVIGSFFENYVRMLITYSFPELLNPNPLLFEDLKVEGIEYGDIYIRINERIALGELKSSNIPSMAKSDGTPHTLYNNDKPKFFKTHGMDQLLENLKTLCNGNFIPDTKLYSHNNLTIYPLLFTCERLLTYGLFPIIFRQYFDNKIDRSLYPNFDIKPLLVIHISDLENLQEYFRGGQDLFELLDTHLLDFPVAAPLVLTYSTWKNRIPGYLVKRFMEGMED